METISTSMARMESEPEENESKEGILNRNIPLVNLAMPSKYLKCGEVFIEDTLKFILVCALCEKQFTEMELFGAHITSAHWSSDKYEPFLIDTVKPEFIEEDPFQDEDSINGSANASCDEISDGMDSKQKAIKESASQDSDNTSRRSTKKPIQNRKQFGKYLEQGKWADFCGRCGLKFKYNEDYEIHCILKHGNPSTEEKTQLERVAASIVYIAHTCPVCYSTHAYKNIFVSHLKMKHSMDPESIQTVLAKEFLSTREDTKHNQILTQGGSPKKSYRRTVLLTKYKSKQTQENVQKQQSEVIDPESFVVNEDSPAIESDENLTDPLPAITNMETIDSMTSDNEIAEQEFETDMYRTFSILNRKKFTKYLEQGKWVDFCGKCGLKFKYNEDYEIHCKLKHGNPSTDEKTHLERVAASIVYIAHTCPICYSSHAYKNIFVSHLKMKHSMDHESIQKVLAKEFLSTRDDTKNDQILTQSGSPKKSYERTVFKHKSKQTQENVQKQQSEDIDPECFVVNEDSPVTESDENLTDALPAITNMETIDSMTSDNEIAEEKFETEMEPASQDSDNPSQRSTEKPISNRKIISKYLEQGKWAGFCGYCGLKFKYKEGFEIHRKLRHGNLSTKEKTQLEKVAASIVYIAHTCPICCWSNKRKTQLVSHLKMKHSLDPDSIKSLLREELLSTRKDTEDDQEPASQDSDNPSQRSTKKAISNRKIISKYLEQGIWAGFCGYCGLKFKYKEGFEIHRKLRHGNLSTKEKTKLEKVAASIVYIAHTCPICCWSNKRKTQLVSHLKIKHSLDPDSIKSLLREELLSTRNDTEDNQILPQGGSRRKSYHRPTVLQTKHKLKQRKENVKKEQSEAIDPKSFVVNEDSPAIECVENLAESLPAIINMETTDSMPSDNELAEEEFETEMDVANEECSNATPQISKQQADKNYDVTVEKRITPIRETSKQNAPNVVSEMESNDSINKNLWVAFCAKCGLKFRYKLGYELHNQLKHSDLPAELKDQLEKKSAQYLDVLETVLFVCAICGYGCKYASALRDHLRLKHDMEPGKRTASVLEEKQNTQADSNQMVSIEQLLKPDLVTDIEATIQDYQERAKKPEDVSNIVSDMQSNDSINKSLWVEYCRICNLKFRYKIGYELHKLLKHVLPVELKNKLEKECAQYLNVLVNVPFVCAICGYNCKFGSGLRIHLKLKHNMKPRKTTALMREEKRNTLADSNQMVSIEQLLKPDVVTHIEEAIRECQLKIKKPQDVATIVSDMQSHDSINKNLWVAFCAKCGLKFRYKLGYELHKQLKHNHLTAQQKYKLEKECAQYLDVLVNVPFVCALCGYRCRYNTFLRDHLRLKHNMEPEKRGAFLLEEKQNTQADSNQMVSIEQLLKPDVVTHIEEAIRQSQLKTEEPEVVANIVSDMQSNDSIDKNLWVKYCPICGLKFRYKLGYELHKQLKHNYLPAELKNKLEKECAQYLDVLVNVPFVCAICGYCCRYRCFFRDHLKLKHNMEPEKRGTIILEEKQNSQADSNQMASIEQLLEPDVVTHIEEAIRECQPKTEKPEEVSNIVSDMQSNDSIDKNLWVENCPKCGIRFRYKLGYELHKQLKHDDLPTELKDKLEKKCAQYLDILLTVPFVCAICGCCFKNNSGFSVHLRQKHNMESGKRGAFILTEKQNTQADSNQMVSIEQLLKPDVVTHIEEAIRECQPKTEKPEDVLLLGSDMQSNDSVNKNLWVEYCTICGIRFRYKLGYELHKQLKHNDLPAELKDELEKKCAPYLNVLVNVPFVCAICGSCCKYRSAFSVHLRVKHNKEAGERSALILEERQNSQADSNQMVSIEQLLKPDAVTHVEAAIREFQQKTENLTIQKGRKCTECNMQFKASNGYNFHMRVKHGIMTKRYQEKYKTDKYIPPCECQYCGKRFHMSTDLKFHEAVHLGEKNHKCPHCPRAFSHPANLRTHIDGHLNIRRYKCSFCNLRFVSSTGKKLHERVHAVTKEMPFQCEECGKLFSKGHILRDHMLKHKNIRPYECNKCGKTFSSRHNLHGHMNIHKGDIFTCGVCGRTMTTKKALRNHMLLHGNQKKYVCQICDKAFAQCAGLYAHRKSHEVSEYRANT